MATWEVAVHAAGALGEAPFWDDVHGCLWFVDITGGALHRFDPATSVHECRSLGAPLSAAIPSIDGDLMLTQGNDVYRYDWAGDTRRRVGGIQPADPTMQLNDAACDAVGRLWAGTIDVSYGRGRSSLLRFGAGGPDAVLSSRGLANGIAWSPDGDTMYFVDSQRRAIEAFDYDAASGAVSAARVWHQFAEQDGFPDGIAVDDEGDVWVALYGGKCVHHYTYDRQLAEVLPVPVDRVTNLCFGGPALSDLYVTTSAHRRTSAEAEAQPLAGCTFIATAAGRGRLASRWDPATMN